MKKILISLGLIFIFSFGRAQIRTVTYDYNSNILNGSMALPAEENFTVKGSVDPNVTLVSLDIFKNKRRSDTLFSVEWRRASGNYTPEFVLPVNYLLRANAEYDFVFHFYKNVEDSSRLNLYRAIKNNLKAYLENSIETKSDKIVLSSSVGTTLEEMNTLVSQSFLYYKNILPDKFPGFSDLVRRQLKNLKNKKISKSSVRLSQKSAEGKRMLDDYLNGLRNNLVEVSMSEIEPYLGGKMVVVSDMTELKQFPTEKTSHSLALNVGYGGVYLSGSLKHMYNESAPYAGVSFPLGNKKFSPFLGNTSVSLGVFLKNFKDEEGNKVSGPIVGLPYFLGLGYKFLNIFRLQAGAVATSTKEINQIEHLSTKDFKIRPFVGLSAEINLWLGFNENRK